MIVLTRRRLVAYFSIVLLLQLLLFTIRAQCTHYVHALLLRFQMLVGLESAMIAADVIIWNRVTRMFHEDSTQQQQSHSQKSAPKKSPFVRFVRDSLKAVVLLFLLLAHACFALFYVVPGDEPHLLALVAFVAIAGYIHLIALFTLAHAIEYGLSFDFMPRKLKRLKGTKMTGENAFCK